MNSRSIALIHYTLPPVVGGVEAVILAQTRAAIQAGYSVKLISGRGEKALLPPQCDLELIPEVDTLHPEIAQITAATMEGRIPDEFESMVNRLTLSLKPVIENIEHVIIHNVMTKHFNLPLTVALVRLVEIGAIRHAIAWCHDFSWSSSSSRHKVHPGYPWDYLRTFLDGVAYVTVSQRRREELANLFGCAQEKIFLVYNGVDPDSILGLSDDGQALINRLGLLESDLILIMPVRVTQAKNIESALRVLASLKASCRNPRLILTGPPDPHDPGSMQYYQSLLDLRSRLGLDTEMRFVYESGPVSGKPHIISEKLVGELIRASDIVFLPSHREGFGMPVLEAGLAGIPVVTTDIPASREIGREDVHIFPLDISPDDLAECMLSLINNAPTSRLRRRIRLSFSWEAIFRNATIPLLEVERS